MIGLGDITNAKLKVGDVDVLAAYVGDIKVYDSASPEPTDYSTHYLTFVVTDSNGAAFGYIESDTPNRIYYSSDGGSTWAILEPDNYGATTELFPQGTKVMLKGECTPNTTRQLYGIGYLFGEGEYEIEGNPMSLLFGDNFIGQTDLTGYDYAFYSLFDPYNITEYPNPGINDNIKDISRVSLPATTLSASCYRFMFRECQYITATPELPAMTLADSCYRSMFNLCISLTTAPALPATTIATYCYQSMFRGCSSLTTAPELPATQALTNCYSWMFEGCSSINYIKCLATNITGSSYTINWVGNVAQNGTFVCSNRASWTTGANGIPGGWTVQYV